MVLITSAQSGRNCCALFYHPAPRYIVSSGGSILSFTLHVSRRSRRRKPPRQANGMPDPRCVNCTRLKIPSYYSIGILHSILHSLHQVRVPEYFPRADGMFGTSQTFSVYVHQCMHWFSHAFSLVSEIALMKRKAGDQISCRYHRLSQFDTVRVQAQPHTSGAGIM